MTSHPNQSSSFPTTRWTLIFELRGADSAGQMHALGELCGLYWYPIYAHFRRRGRPPADAEDMTQGFFEHVVRSSMLERAEGSRGRLRSFLLGSAERFLISEVRRQTAAKRGGGVVVESLDVEIDREDGERRLAKEIAHPGEDPRTAFYRSWAQTMVESAQEALAEEYRTRGRSKDFAVLLPYLFWNSGEAPYEAPAAELGISVEAIRAAVLRLRRRFGETLRTQIRFTVEDDSEIDAEIRDLFAALASD